MNNQTLTHFDSAGQAHMVDVGAKAETARIARAAGSIFMKPETLALIRSGAASKGDVLGIARIAGAADEVVRLVHPAAFPALLVLDLPALPGAMALTRIRGLRSRAASRV